MSWDNGIRHSEGCSRAGRATFGQQQAAEVLKSQAQGQKAESISTAYVLAVDAKTGATYRLIIAWKCAASTVNSAAAGYNEAWQQAATMARQSPSAIPAETESLHSPGTSLRRGRVARHKLLARVIGGTLHACWLCRSRSRAGRRPYGRACRIQDVGEAVQACLALIGEGNCKHQSAG